MTNLANYLGEADQDRAGQRAHRLAAALQPDFQAAEQALAEILRVAASAAGG